MSAPERELGEFETIERLFRSLTGGAPGAFDLMDDAAVLPSRRTSSAVIAEFMPQRSPTRLVTPRDNFLCPL